MRPGKLARVLAVALLAAACNSTPSPSPTGATGSSAATATSGPGDSAGPGGSAATPDTAAPTSASKIADGLARGALDEPTSILYRLYAAFGDDRLPAEYQGAPSEDGAASELAHILWDELSAEQQAGILPFLVRPTSPHSWYAPASAAGTASGAQLASVRTAAACTNGFIRQQVSPTIPVLIWGQCGGRSEATVIVRVQEIAEVMDALWEPMTTYMGEPLGDQNIAGDTFADSPEGGDGLLDIYVVDTSLSLHGRTVSTGALASTRGWTPWVGPAGAEATSGYITVPATGQTGVELKSTMAHEFFHVLEYAHNNRGMLYAGGRFWFMEASAVWSEHEFVPEARDTEVYPRFKDFQATSLSLTAVDGDNEYNSWAWPLFMRQELGRDAIVNAWTALEGKDGFEPSMAVLDGMLPFEGRFRDFAVRVWNEELNPGSPVNPRFHALDGDFPDTQPTGTRVSLGNPVTATGYFEAFPKLPSLWSKYWVVEPDSNVRSLAFDFSTLLPIDRVDVELILNIKGTWQRRSGNLADEEKICDVDYAIVIVANHDPDPNAEVNGGWAVHGDPNECASTGSWTVTLTGPMTGAGTHTGTGLVTCTRLDYGGTYYWGASMVDLQAAFGTLSNWSMSEEPGRELLLANVGGLEGGVWLAQTGSLTASVTGSGAPGANAHVSGQGSFRYGEDGPVFTIDIAADCSETYY